MTAPQRATRAQHLRQLAGMARAALAEFPVEPTRIQFVALNTNAVYRVFTATGTYALRLALPGWRTADDLPQAVPSFARAIGRTLEHGRLMLAT